MSTAGKATLTIILIIFGEAAFYVGAVLVGRQVLSRYWRSLVLRIRSRGRGEREEELLGRGIEEVGRKE